MSDSQEHVGKGEKSWKLRLSEKNAVDAWQAWNSWKWRKMTWHSKQVKILKISTETAWRKPQVQKPASGQQGKTEALA